MVDLKYLKKLEDTYGKKVEQTLEEQVLLYLCEEMKILIKDNERLTRNKKKTTMFLRRLDEGEDDEGENDY